MSTAAVAERREIVLTDEERQRCEVWTRVMGYHRPVSQYNPGKKSEHAEREHFQESQDRSGTCTCHHDSTSCDSSST